MTPRAKTESKPGRILVVGEAKLGETDFEALLVGASHAVETVADGEQARDYLVQRSPEIILVDLDLPDGSGLDLLPDLKELDRLAAILVSGSQADAPMVVEAMRRGADNFLTENLTREDFLECVDRALQRHRTERRALVYQEAVESRLGNLHQEIVDSVKGAYHMTLSFVRFQQNPARIESFIASVTVLHTAARTSGASSDNALVMASTISGRSISLPSSATTAERPSPPR